MADDLRGNAAAVDGLAVFVERFIRDYLDEPAHNHLGPGSVGKAWADVLIGFSGGADPLFLDLKEHVGPFHWTPLEAFALAGDAPSFAEGSAVEHLVAEDLSVISWALCQNEEAKDSNSRETRYPSDSWARARMFGQECNNALHMTLIGALGEAGYRAVAPALLPEWTQLPSERFSIASTWSERHVAYVSGLGTFGLAGGLITTKGQAVRFGSVVVRARIPATPRPYTGPFDYCLFFSRGICGHCVDRCPVGSVRRGGRDKRACSRHLGPAMREYVETRFGFTGYACGLCQTGVPCASRIPDPEDVAHRG